MKLTTPGAYVRYKWSCTSAAPVHMFMTCTGTTFTFYLL